MIWRVGPQPKSSGALFNTTQVAKRDIANQAVESIFPGLDSRPPTGLNLAVTG
jgi:hypothetical protein